MIFEPLYITLAKRIGVAVVIIGSYLWVSTDEYEFEQSQQHTVPAQPPIISGPDPEELPVYPEPEQAIPGWIVPPEPVRKSVAKVKRRIKRSVEKR